jgi:D-sedoheptulose 7-phosphate isomerase
MEVKEYFNTFKNVLDKVDVKSIYEMINEIYDSYNKSKTIFIIGNGGSAANASHFAQDLSKGVILDQTVKKRIRALSLTDNIGYITALANDDGYENIFVAQMRTFSNESDILIAISGSGNSENIIEAVTYAKKNNIKVIGITGYDGGKLKKLSDISIHVPLNEMCMVESIHSVIFHFIITSLRQKITNQIVNFDK